MRTIRSNRPAGRLITAAAIILFFTTPALPAQIAISNPGFPATESITYIRSSDHGSEMVEVEMTLVPANSSAARPYYEYRMQSESKDMLVKLDAGSLEIFYSEVWIKNTYSTIHRINEIVEQSKPTGPGDLLVCDGNGLEVRLRGFPWARHDQAQLAFLNGSDKFKIGLKIAGRETLRLNNTTYECRKVQMGIDGFLGSLFPKSYFWYTVDQPHILVRAEVAEMMGEDAHVIELVSYSTALSRY
jgi:hypothetical protein